MVTLDFSKCKTPEDVQKVYEEADKDLKVIKNVIQQAIKLRD